MTFDQGIDWALRGLMLVLTIWVFLWGKSAKQAEALLAAQLQIRDTKLDEIIRRLDHAGQKSSDMADKVMERLNDHSERLAVVEMQIRDRRTGAQERRTGSDERRHGG